MTRDRIPRISANAPVIFSLIAFGLMAAAIVFGWKRRKKGDAS